MYKKYRKYRSYDNQPSPFEMLVEGIVEIIAWLIYFLAKLIFKLIQKILRAFVGDRKGFFKVNDVSPQAYVPETPVVTSDNVYKRYCLRQSLITPAEKGFLNVLEQVVGDRYVIESQVQLSRIVTPLDSSKNFTNYRDFNQIKAKSIDFVLYNKDYRPYLCIELDDRSHLQWGRIKRDMFVDEVMKDVGLRIIHIRVAYSYDLENLKRQIFQNS
jgi:hypothetical protein